LKVIQLVGQKDLGYETANLFAFENGFVLAMPTESVECGVRGVTEYV